MALEQWNSEKIFFSGEEYFEAVFTDIEKAKTSIDLETYIFDLDIIGLQIVERLFKASDRGVKIRIIADAYGSSLYIDKLAKIFARKNPLGNQIEFKAYHPLFFRGFIPIFRTINNRNHRKTWIFDSKIVYAGSYNISMVHTTSAQHTPWRDCGLRVEGQHVGEVMVAFSRAWSSTLQKIREYNFRPVVKNGLVRLNSRPSSRNQYNRNLLNEIKNAKEKIWIGNAYFAPRIRLISALRKSAKRGVDVRLLVPQQSDVFFMPWVSASYYFIMFKVGIRIYEYLPAVYHGKVFVADSWMMVGSSNLNHRSSLHDLEIDLQVTHSENQRLLIEELKADFAVSKPIEKNFFTELTWTKRLLGGFFLLFKWWI